MLTRGCAPGAAFCGAEASWGAAIGRDRHYRSSTRWKSLVRRQMLQLQDDTFTTNRKRVIALCKGIRERKLGFLWSCDTRVDVLGDELLREMRLADW